MMPRDECIRAT